MTHHRRMSRLLLLAGTGVAMHGALAQEQTQDPPAPQRIESVQVTGTRITLPGMVSTSPISTVTADQIKSSQPVAVEEFIKTLPVAVASIGPGTNNGTSGAATIDLRGLGANRTLVMIDGRRMVPFNLNGTVDTNSIPIALLNSVDLLTGGASVVYGADAVAGVVNFNLKKNFSGFDATTSYGRTSNDKDGRRKRTDLTWGVNLEDGRGNVTLSVGKTTSDPVTQGSRPYAVTSLSSTTGLATGSATTIPGAFSIPRGTTGTATLSGAWQIDPASGQLVTPVVPYNTNPVNYYQTGLDRTQATALAHFKINDHADVYSEVFYTTSDLSSTLAESGTFGNVFDIPIGNPYIPAAARQQICDRRGISAANCVVGNATLVPMTVNRRFVELGPRINQYENKTLQYTVGVKGEVGWDWTYDAYWTHGTADQTQLRQNWGSLSKVAQALNAISTTACVNTANNCVPLNVFGAAGSITPEQLAFINQSTIQRVAVTQDVASLSFSGDLGNRLVLPWAGLPVSLALNGEERKVSAKTRADAPSQIQGEVLGSGAPAVDSQGEFKLREFSAETIIPLVRDKSWFKSLNAELGYRRTEFSNSGEKNRYGSWKVGGDWQPVTALRFRVNAQKATRAPNINELYAPLVTGLSNLSADPCQLASINQAQAFTAGTLSNLCRLTGVPVSEIGSLPAPSSNQINNLTGGNPKLGPEEAKTRTIGLVWEPLPRLAISLDYYKITIDKAVSSKSTTDVLDGCYKNNPGYTFNADCALIGRHPANGTFNGALSKGVATPFSNLGYQATGGFDLNLAYKLPLKNLNLDPKYGALDLNFGLNQVNNFHFKATPTSIDRNCLGYYSTACANVGNTTAPVYKRKFSQRTTWNVGDFNLGYNWRYQSAVDVEPGSGNFLPQFSHIKAYNYLDLSAAWSYNKNLRLSVAVNNAANKKPPIVGASVASTAMDSGNTFPQAYDAIGRYLTFAANLRF